jgi:hypothetical protein
MLKHRIATTFLLFAVLLILAACGANTPAESIEAASADKNGSIRNCV